jgi:hypothetical protein
MPQHLKIEVEGRLVGWLSTHNKGGTLYDIRLRVPEVGTDFWLPDADTGVQRRPQDSKARADDFRDDFTHARRCIGGAIASADNLLQKLQESGAPEYAEMKPITMRLMTNEFDRGFIHVLPRDHELVDVDVIIGVGAHRVPSSSPKEKCELNWQGIDASGMYSQTARALKVLQSIGPALLQALSERAAH